MLVQNVIEDYCDFSLYLKEKDLILWHSATNAKKIKLLSA